MNKWYKKQELWWWFAVILFLIVWLPCGFFIWKWFINLMIDCN